MLKKNLNLCMYKKVGHIEDVIVHKNYKGK